MYLSLNLNSSDIFTSKFIAMSEIYFEFDTSAVIVPVL